MKSLLLPLLLSSPLLATTAATNAATTAATAASSSSTTSPSTTNTFITPIYLGEVFWPPTMTFLAWIAPSDPSPDPQDWCRRATDASNHKLFSLAHPQLGAVDALRIEDYFSPAASISREGKTWATCAITPESMRIGACEGVADWECEGGHRYTGPGTRRWTCWPVVEEAQVQRQKKNETQSVQRVGVPGDILTPTGAMSVVGGTATGAVSSSMAAAFTAGATGQS